MSRVICVLGMHRSGTSMVTRVINLLGVPSEPSGTSTQGIVPQTWEYVPIVNLNQEMLQSLQVSWTAEKPLPEGWMEKCRQFKPRMKELVRRFEKHNVWVWKDPRTTLLLPLWKEVFNEMQIEMEFVYVVRNPINVAHSLRVRDNFSLEKGVNIWLNANFSALSHIEGVQTIFVSYERMLEHSEYEVKRLASLLLLPNPDLKGQ